MPDGNADRNQELASKVAIVTGSARNIGRSIAEELARAGAAVTINAASALDLAEEVADGIKSTGGQAIAVKADITDPGDVQRLVDSTVEAFGGLDILINNAAVRSNVEFTELTFEEWERCRAVALDGAFRMCMASVPHMIERGGGAIVSIGGMNAYKGVRGGAHKSAVKEGMSGMVRGMVYDLGAHNITTNIAVVGPFDTERKGGSGMQKVVDANPNIPMGRRGGPQDMADLVRFLVGPYATFITGQTIHVNGGAHMPH